MFELFVILALILANGVFAMSEIAVVSSRKAKLQGLASEGNKRAQAALALADNPNRFLATVQIGITLVGIFAGAYGGATLSQPLAAVLEGVPVIGRYSGSISLVIVVISITYLSLVVGELVPKRMALNAPERIAMTVAGFMNTLSVITAPFVRLLSWSTEGMLRLLQVKKSEEAPVSDEEINALLEQGTQAGVFEEAEQDIVENLFRLGDRRVSEIMTPRRNIVWLDADAPVEAAWKLVEAHKYSRFVLCRGGLDQVIGVVHTRDLLVSCLAPTPVDLLEVSEKPLFVPEALPALKLLDQFKATGMHLAIALDEYGSVEGLVTLNDVLEALVGELPTVGQAEEPMIVTREDGSFLIDGLLPVDDLKEALDIDRLPLEEERGYRTLGGFVTTFLGRIPAVADRCVWEQWRFEVVDMDGQRVDKVLVIGAKDDEMTEGGTGRRSRSEV